MAWSTADIVKIDEHNEKLIGPSGMEILKKEIDGFQEFKKSRAEEQYKLALKNLAKKWFEIKFDEFDQLKPQQITALEILADKRVRKSLKTWLWINVIFAVGIGVASLLVSPYFLFGLMALATNFIPMDLLEYHLRFRKAAKQLNKKFDPKLMIDSKKPLSFLN